MEILPTLQVNTGFCQNSMILVVLVIGMIILKVTLRKVVPMKISKNLLDLDLQTPQQVPRLLQLPEWLLVQLLVESLWQVIFFVKSISRKNLFVIILFIPPLGMNGKIGEKCFQYTL